MGPAVISAAAWSSVAGFGAAASAVDASGISASRTSSVCSFICSSCTASFASSCGFADEDPHPVRADMAIMEAISALMIIFFIEYPPFEFL